MNDAAADFTERLNGRFLGMLEWQDLDRLWERITASGKPWYLYQVGAEVPTRPLDGDDLRRALQELDALLHKEHRRDYCGIVYADNPERPTLVKVYDPNNLGSSCGSSGRVILPGWILSLQQPTDVSDDIPVPRNRLRWWKRLTGG